MEKQNSERQQEAGHGGDVEGKAPSVMRGEVSTQKITGSRSNRNGEVENAENASAQVLREQVGNKRWSDGYECCFANSHQRVAQQQLTVGVGKGGKQSEGAPEQPAERDDQFARIPVGEWTDKGRGKHIKKQERAGQISELSFREMEIDLNERLHRVQYRAIDIVDEVECSEDDQCGASLEPLRGHRLCEYSTGKQACGKSRLASSEASSGLKGFRHECDSALPKSLRIGIR